MEIAFVYLFYCVVRAAVSDRFSVKFYAEKVR